MEELFTAQMVQKLLKVNRITVYRMLRDGRLKGIKIGSQWRFPSGQFDELLSGSYVTDIDTEDNLISGFPSHCIQTIQDLFADLGQIGAITVSSQGKPLTLVSSPCSSCEQLLKSSNGRKACNLSWQEITSDSRKSGWYLCHAGMQYYKSPINMEGKTICFLLTGQLSSDLPEQQKRRKQVETMAGKFSMAVESILQERSNLVDRLQKIVEIGTIK